MVSVLNSVALCLDECLDERLYAVLGCGSTDADCDREYHEPACWVEIHFDTAYAYRDERSRGCGDLHAQLLFDLGQWFDERKIDWGWQNECTGEWHYEDKYRALKELCTDGGKAMAWFVETVQPLIESLATP